MIAQAEGVQADEGVSDIFQLTDTSFVFLSESLDQGRMG